MCGRLGVALRWKGIMDSTMGLLDRTGPRAHRPQTLGKLGRPHRTMPRGSEPAHASQPLRAAASHRAFLPFLHPSRQDGAYRGMRIGVGPDGCSFLRANAEPNNRKRGTALTDGARSVNGFVRRHQEEFQTPEPTFFRLVRWATRYEPATSKRLASGYENEVYVVRTREASASVVGIRRWGEVDSHQEAWAINRCREADVPVRAC